MEHSEKSAKNIFTYFKDHDKIYTLYRIKRKQQHVNNQYKNQNKLNIIYIF